ncbi:NAD(P)-binding protein [Aureobasidium sp. EXF-10728]|nr:NAD(P)-binding protein [Aureobasidium sp. EXF-10728]
MHTTNDYPPVKVDNEIKGRLALITGASGGIGAACARQLAAQGVHLALTYASNLKSCQRLADELKSEPANADLKITIHKADLASIEETTALCPEVIKQHGRVIDILVSNAGYGVRIQNVWEIPLEEFEHTINVNLRATFLLVKGVVEGMRDQRWGRMIFISSIAAYGAGINGCHYAASKGGLQSMMKNLSSRLAPYNISVNDVSPAMVGSTGLLPSADSVPGVVDNIPLQRLCAPEEVANVVSMYCKTGFATYAVLSTSLIGDDDPNV